MPSRVSPVQHVVEGQSRDGQHPCASQGAEERGLIQIVDHIRETPSSKSSVLPPPQKKTKKQLSNIWLGRGRVCFSDSDLKSTLEEYTRIPITNHFVPPLSLWGFD